MRKPRTNIAFGVVLVSVQRGCNSVIHAESVAHGAVMPEAPISKLRNTLLATSQLEFYFSLA